MLFSFVSGFGSTTIPQYVAAGSGNFRARRVVWTVVFIAMCFRFKPCRIWNRHIRCLWKKRTVWPEPYYPCFFQSFQSYRWFGLAVWRHILYLSQCFIHYTDDVVNSQKLSRPIVMKGSMTVTLK